MGHLACTCMSGGLRCVYLQLTLGICNYVLTHTNVSVQTVYESVHLYVGIHICVCTDVWVYPGIGLGPQL